MITALSVITTAKDADVVDDDVELPKPCETDVF